MKHYYERKKRIFIHMVLLFSIFVSTYPVLAQRLYDETSIKKSRNRRALFCKNWALATRHRFGITFSTPLKHAVRVLARSAFFWLPKCLLDIPGIVKIQFLMKMNGNLPLVPNRQNFNYLICSLSPVLFNLKRDQKLPNEFVISTLSFTTV